MKKLRKFTKYALTAILGLFIGLSMNAQETSKNPLDNADKGLVYTQKQQDKLTQELTTFWTNELTPIKTAEWNEKLTKKLTATWNEKLTANVSTEIEGKLTPKLTTKWGLILNDKYPNNVKSYRQ